MTEKSQSRRVEETFENNLKRRFRWDKEERINSLIQCMLSYKPEIMFEEKNSNADKVKLYESVRQKLAKICIHELSSFGPPNLERYPFMGRDDISLDEIEQEEKTIWCMIEKYIKGYSRTREKIKEIRQNFSQKVISGRCSGSGKVMLEFYDDLAKLWGGSPSTESLACVIS